MKPAASLLPQPATLAVAWPKKARPAAPLVKWLLWFTPLLLALCLQGLASAAHAQDDPPGRVGRLASLQGTVSWFDPEEGQWVDAERNRPLTSGDRVATGGNGRAELRVGSSVLRLAAYTELEVLRLDDDRMVWQLHSGSVAVRLRSRDAALETELVTGEIRLQPERAGHYRIDRVDDTTWAAAWRGSLRSAQAEDPVLVEAGQRLELWRDSPRWPGTNPAVGAGAVAASTAPLRQRADRLADDEFAAWAQAEDRQDERSAAYRYVSPEMTGAEDLDRHGRWEQHPEYGAMWFPTVTVAGWAPYRFGRWTWVQPWGWTWVDDARWGFAPFHYGRWVNWRGRWAWCPGSYVARPVFAPALVAWVGGPRLGVSVSIGRPPVAWVPLAPREVFVPYYRHSPVYVDRVNVYLAPPGPPPRHGRLPSRQQPVQQTGPMVYTNQGVPGAVTVVPRDVLLQRQPVARAVVDVQPGGPRYDGRSGGGGGWEAVAPPVIERRQRPVPGRDDNAERGRPWPGRPELREPRDARDPREPREPRDPRSPRGGTAPVVVPGLVTEPTMPARGPAVQPPVVAPVVAPVGAGGVPALPPVRQPPQPPLQTMPPLAPAVSLPAAPAGPNGPSGPRFQVPATEPQQPQAGQRTVPPGSDSRPPRDQRAADRRHDDMPRWSGGPQRPAGPATGATSGGSMGPVSPPSTAERPAPPAPPAPPASPASPAPPPAAAQPAKPPAQQPAPAPARSEKPREADRGDRPAAAERADKPDAEEGRKRVPDYRNRPREQLN